MSNRKSMKEEGKHLPFFVDSEMPSKIGIATMSLLPLKVGYSPCLYIVEWHCLWNEPASAVVHRPPTFGLITSFSPCVYKASISTAPVTCQKTYIHKPRFAYVVETTWTCKVKLNFHYSHFGEEKGKEMKVPGVATEQVREEGEVDFTLTQPPVPPIDEPP